jgi:hypothetical protein
MCVLNKGGATQVKWSKLNPMQLVATHGGEIRVWDLRVFDCFLSLFSISICCECCECCSLFFVFGRMKCRWRRYVQRLWTLWVSTRVHNTKRSFSVLHKTTQSKYTPFSFSFFLVSLSLTLSRMFFVNVVVVVNVYHSLLILGWTVLVLWEASRMSGGFSNESSTLQSQVHGTSSTQMMLLKTIRFLFFLSYICSLLITFFLSFPYFFICDLCVRVCVCVIYSRLDGEC